MNKICCSKCGIESKIGQKVWRADGIQQLASYKQNHSYSTYLNSTSNEPIYSKTPLLCRLSKISKYIIKFDNTCKHDEGSVQQRGVSFLKGNVSSAGRTSWINVVTRNIYHLHTNTDCSRSTRIVVLIRHVFQQSGRPSRYILQSILRLQRFNTLIQLDVTAC